jgi:type I restriction enzyme R subunit
VIRGKPLESSTLQRQAAANSKEQFSHSPDLNNALLDAIIGALDAHQLMSTQALNSEDVREGMLDILLNHTDLYENL